MSEPDDVPFGQSPGSVADGDLLDEEFSIYSDAGGEDGSKGEDDEVQGEDEELLP